MTLPLATLFVLVAFLAGLTGGIVAIYLHHDAPSAPPSTDSDPYYRIP